MAKDQLGNNLNIGDRVIVTLLNPFAVGTVVAIDNTEILSTGSGVVKTPQMGVTINVPLAGAVCIAQGVLKLSDPKKGL